MTLLPDLAYFVGGDLERCVATIRGSIAQLPGRIWLKAPKSNRIATIALSRTAVQALRAQRLQQKHERLKAHGSYEVSGHVFTQADGRRQTPGQSVKQFAGS